MVNVATMPIRLQMVTTPDSFADKVVRAMHAELVRKLGSRAFQQSVQRGARGVLEASLKSQPEYLSMIFQDGELRKELGVADSQSAMDSLVRVWVRSVQVRAHTPRMIGPRIAGTIISIRAIQANYEDVLGRAFASYTSVNRRGEETHVPWLDWLLTKGVEIMVQTHAINHPEPPTARSRTHTNTIMKKTKGQGWGVPTDFAGVADNNFATRAIKESIEEIKNVIRAETQRRF